MTDSSFDAQLAWDISEWAENYLPEEGRRGRIELLAQHLTEKGYAKQSELVASAAYLEAVGTTISDKFLPAYEAIMKGKRRDGPD